MILKKKVNAQYISLNKVLYFPYKRPHPWLLVFEKKIMKIMKIQINNTKLDLFLWTNFSKNFVLMNFSGNRKNSLER